MKSGNVNIASYKLSFLCKNCDPMHTRKRLAAQAFLLLADHTE